MSDTAEPESSVVEPKFHVGDIVRCVSIWKYDEEPFRTIGQEYEVTSVFKRCVIRLKRQKHSGIIDCFELVFRPATREETEALRRVAKAADIVMNDWHDDAGYEVREGNFLNLNLEMLALKEIACQ